MAILARIFIRLILWLIVATWLGRKLFGWLLPAPKPQAPRFAPQSPRRLYRDPWCGIHVSEEISLPFEHAGQLHHFCSVQCRERYRLFHARDARA